MSGLVPTSTRLPTGQLVGRREPDWLLAQLPVGLLGADFFRRFSSIFQELGTGLLEDADNVEHVADVSVAPPSVVRWLGSWIGAHDIDEEMPVELQRRMVASAARALTRRGTAQGLRDFLELVSGGPAEITEGGGIWRAGEAPRDTAWLRIRVASSGLLSIAELVEVLRDEVPAHARAELYVADRRVWSSEENDR